MSPALEPAPGAEAPEVLVVATWYPGVEDLGAGRFVADQVVALEASKRVVPLVVSFDRLPPVGGAEARGRPVTAVHAALAEAMRSEWPLFHSAAFGVEPPVRIARLGIAEGVIRAIGTTSSEYHRLAVLRDLADRIDRDGSPRPVLVHAHTGYPDGAAAAELAERLGCPLVITEHVTYLARILADYGQRASYARACERAARVVAVSEILADQIRSALPHVADRVVVVPNAIAVDEFRAPGLDQREQDELLFVGYRKEIKGIDTLLEAFALVVSKRPAARLRLIGGSPNDELEARWKAMAARLDITDRVSFEGILGRSGIADAMARASVFVHASRYETFGVVAAEALAAGLPLVATNSGGVTDILGPSPERFGALVAVDDGTALGEAILETLGRRASFEAETLRASVRERFGASVVADRLTNLYDDVLAEWKRSRAVLDMSTVPVLMAEWRSPGNMDGPMVGVTTRTVILGLDRRNAAKRLSRLPMALVADLRLVTSREPTSVALPALQWLAEVGLPAVPTLPARGYRVAAGQNVLWYRLGRFLGYPVRLWRRRAIRAALDKDIVTAARELQLVMAQIVAEQAGAAAPFDVVPLDGRDVEVLGRIAPDPSWRMSVGGLGRLGDRLASGGDHPRADS